MEASTFEVVFVVRRIDSTSICYYASAVCIHVLGRLTCVLLCYAISHSRFDCLSVTCSCLLVLLLLYDIFHTIAFISTR